MWLFEGTRSYCSEGNKDRCVIAKSFARIFFRNSINIGVALLECPDTDRIADGDELSVDFASGVITNVTRNEKVSGNPSSGLRQGHYGCRWPDRIYEKNYLITF